MQALYRSVLKHAHWNELARAAIDCIRCHWHSLCRASLFRWPVDRGFRTVNHQSTLSNQKGTQIVFKCCRHFYFYFPPKPEYGNEVKILVDSGETDRQRQTETDRQTDRDRNRERNRQTERDRDRELRKKSWGACSCVTKKYQQRSHEANTFDCLLDWTPESL